MQQHDGLKVIARAFIAHMHLHAFDRDEGRGRRGPSGRERVHRAIRGPAQGQGPARHQRHQRQKDQQQAQRLEQPLHDTLPTQLKGALRMNQPTSVHGQAGTQALAGSRSMAATMALQPDSVSTIRGVF